MITLENESAIIQVKLKGAELCSFQSKAFQTEYIWQADPKYWNRHSPILFPIVGSLKNNQFQFENKYYSLPRHGFARDCDFECIKTTENTLVFRLESSIKTKEFYPFDFILFVIYTLDGNSLTIQYEVQNPSNERMYFSLGAHPAFNVPFYSEHTLKDYFLNISIDTDQSLPILRYTINQDGLQTTLNEPILATKNEQVKLDYSTFEKDAWVLKNIKAAKVTIASQLTARSVEVEFNSFPFLGIWSRPGADFICIEPWCGVTDSIDSSGKIEDKEGIILLESKQDWKAAFKITID